MAFIFTWNSRDCGSEAADMKGFFLTVLALLLSIAFVRFVYGLQANESSYFVQVILNLPPDIKSDFSVVIEAPSYLGRFLEAGRRHCFRRKYIRRYQDVFQVYCGRV